MGMTISTCKRQPRYYMSEKSAYETLNRLSLSSLPIDLKKVAKGLQSPVIIKTYTWLSRIQSLSRAQIEGMWSSKEGFTQYDPSTDSYVIYLNDNERNRSRLRWTLAHEIGHIVLGHLATIRDNEINLIDDPEDTYSAFELEAHCFARCLLAPPNILFASGIEESINSIMEACDISFSAATKVKDFLARGKDHVHYTVEGIPLIDNFSDYINRWKTGFVCTNCGAQSHSSYRYCTVCGEEYTQWRGIKGVIYGKIELDAESRAKSCPVCGNENIVGDFCQVCGNIVINRCTNVTPEMLSNPWQEDCGKAAPGDARFCPYCGNQTTFGEKQYLIDWETEKLINDL